MDPSDDILEPGASKNHRSLPTGTPDLATRARHGIENYPNTILIDVGAIFDRFGAVVVRFWYCRNRVLDAANHCFNDTYSTKTIQEQKSRKYSAAKAIWDHIL